MSIFYEQEKNSYRKTAKVGNIIIAVVLSLFVVLFMFLGFGFFRQEYDRYQIKKNNDITRQQALLNEQNQVLVNEIQIKQTEQLVQVEQQKADIKVVEAQGIAKAQQIINQTLTDKYLQHEAIQAQEKMAGSPNHTTIYIPSGQNGIPLVQTTN